MKKRSSFPARVVMAIVIISVILAGYVHILARLFWQNNLALADLNPAGAIRYTESDSGFWYLDSGRTFWNYSTDWWGFIFTHSLALGILIVIFHLVALTGPAVQQMQQSIDSGFGQFHFVNPTRIYALHPVSGNEPYVADDPQWRDK